LATTPPEGKTERFDNLYVLPGEMDNDGRSIYRMEDSSTFYGGSVRSGPHNSLVRPVTATPVKRAIPKAVILARLVGQHSTIRRACAGRLQRTI
jgi:hypothetical protein